MANQIKKQGITFGMVQKRVDELNKKLGVKSGQRGSIFIYAELTGGFAAVQGMSDSEVGFSTQITTGNVAADVLSGVETLYRQLHEAIEEGKLSLKRCVSIPNYA